MNKLGIPSCIAKVTPEKPGPLALIIATDWHIGSPYCDMPLIEKIMGFADKMGAYWWLNGDITDNTTRHSVGNALENVLTPNEQMDEVRRLWPEHRRSKVLAVLSGNHEGRTQRDADFDLVQYWANENPPLPYLMRAGVLGLHFNGQVWTLYGMHGVRGGGRKSGASLNALEDMAENVNANIYIHGHHHRASITKKLGLEYHNVNGFFWKPKWFVNGGTMARYGGYAADNAYAPTDTSAYCLLLDSDHHNKGGKLFNYYTLDRSFFGMPR